MGIGKEKAGRGRRNTFTPAGLGKDAALHGGASKDSLRPQGVNTERTAQQKAPGMWRQPGARFKDGATETTEAPLLLFLRHAGELP
jgi:hypothetical protein